MNASKVKYYFFLGIGGIGMSAIARFLRILGNEVLGYDAIDSDITRALQKQGIIISHRDDSAILPAQLNPENTIVILTPAIKQSNLLEYFTKKNFIILKRAQILGQIANQHPLIAVAGTHGKTSTTAIISHILHTQGLLKAGFVGGIAKNYNTNLILPEHQPHNGFIVVEADEYDRSFLQLHPNISLITSIEPDHLDIYSDQQDIKETFEQFVRGNKDKAQIIVNEYINIDIPNTFSTYKYGLDNNIDFFATDINLIAQRQHFTLHLREKKINTFIRFPGRAYLLNSLAAASAAFLAGTSSEIINKGLQTYEGTKRRFELIYSNNGRYIYDDYAHHPSEIEALWESIKQFFPTQKITIVFQPHLFSRTRDFAEGFARSLDKFDEPIITDIYPAREKPIPNVSPDLILDKMENTEKKYIPKNQLIEYLSNNNFVVLLIVGAGNINQIIKPLIEKIS